MNVVAEPVAAQGKRAVVLLSGGLDSATTLALAQEQGYHCFALSFDYGQRHHAELNAAKQIAQELQVAEHKTISLDLSTIGGSALTDTAIAVPSIPSDGIPVTYVPARNTLFLAVALGWAEVLTAEAIFIGINAVDYSGYPDCRPEFIAAFQSLAELATRVGVESAAPKILAPLIDRTKEEIIREGIRLGIDYSLTISCYQTDAAGGACGRCEACQLRRQGFAAADLADPTRYADLAAD